MKSAPLSLTKLLIGGHRWRLREPALEEELQAILHQFPDMRALPGARVLRDNDVRTVCHVPAGGRPPPSAGFLVKVYRYTSRWDRFRCRFQRPRAEQEWYALERFRELGIPTAIPLAITETRRGKTITGGGLIARYLTGTSPLSERLSPRTAGPLPEASRELLVQTGQLVRRMQDLGVWHRDLHAGNILVGNAGNSLYIVDLHTCLFLPRLTRWQRRKGVVELLFSLRASVPPESHRILLDAYEATGPSSAGVLALTGPQLRKSLDALHRKWLTSRARKCFSPSSRFVVARTRGLRLYHLRQWCAEALRGLWSVEPIGRVLETSTAGWIGVVQLGVAPVRVEFRRYTFLEGLCGLLTKHPLRRSYAARHALWVRKESACRVIALRERTVLGLVREAHLVTDPVDG